MHFYISGINFWCESLGRVTSKVENLVFYKHETGVLFVEGFAEKFLFSFQAQSCPRLFRTLPLTLLRQTAAYKYILPIFSEILSAVFMCIQLPGNRVFNPSHCLPIPQSKVCVPAKLHKLTAVVGKVLPFEAFLWHLLFGGSFPSFATISIASCSARSMTYVWKCKRTCSSVA